MTTKFLALHAKLRKEHKKLQLKQQQQLVDKSNKGRARDEICSSSLDFNHNQFFKTYNRPTKIEFDFTDTLIVRSVTVRHFLPRLYCLCIQLPRCRPMLMEITKSNTN